MIIRIRYKYILTFAAALLIFWGFYAAVRNLPVLAKNQFSESVRLPVIMYHEIKDTKLGKDAISAEELEDDLKYLKSKGYTTVTMEDLQNYVYKNKALPEKPIVLSFDDAYLNNYIFAYPLFQEYGAKMVMNVIGIGLDHFTQSPGKSLHYTHMTWNQLNEMIENDILEVQSHTFNMHANTGKSRIGCMPKSGESKEAYVRALTEDLKILEEKVFSKTGKKITAFAYPYGKFSEWTLEAVKDLGYISTLTCEPGINTLIAGDKDSLFQLKRLSRAHNKPLRELLKNTDN